MPTPENYNSSPEEITYEYLRQKREKELIQEQIEKDAMQFRDGVQTKVFYSFGLSIIASEILLAAVFINPKILNEGYENRSYKDENFNYRSYCQKFDEMMNKETLNCETPPIRNLAKSMMYLNIYLLALTTMTNILLDEKVYSLYGDKSSNFRFKWAKESLMAPEISDESIEQNQNTKYNLNAALEKAKMFVTKPVNIAKFRRGVRNAGITAGVGVLGLGCYSFSLYKDYENNAGYPKVGDIPGNECDQGKLTKYYECTPERKDASGEGEARKVGEPKLRTVSRVINGKTVVKKFLINKTQYGGRYIIDNDKEIYLREPAKGNEENGTFTETNISMYANRANNLKITLNKKTGARIIACPDGDVDTAIRINHKHGLETIAIVGTGTIGETNKTKLAEFKSHLGNNKNHRDNWITPYNINKLQVFQDKYNSPAGEVFVRFQDNNKTLFTNLRQSNDQKNPNMNPELRNAGFVTYRNGTSKFLDFLGNDSTKLVPKDKKKKPPFEEKDLERVSTTDEADKKIMNDNLYSLRADSEVQSFSITGWAARQKNGVAKNNSAQSRTIYAFDKTTKELLGVLLTANISFSEINENVRIAFGNNAESLVLDGDFYTGLLNLRKMTKEMVGGNIADRNTNLYFTNAAQCMVVASNNPELNVMSDEMKEVAFIRAQDDLLKDKLSDPWKQFFGILNQLMGWK